MEGHHVPHIIEALRLKDGVVITFADNKIAVYSAALLYAMFSKADELNDDGSSSTDGPTPDSALD